MHKKLITYLIAPRFVLHYCAWKLSCKKAHIDADLEFWKKILELNGCRTFVFFYLLLWKHEFRNLFYCRTAKAAAVILSVLARPERTLLITCPDIGPGVFIQHGLATIIYASSIGSGSWINQQVTIGYNGPGNLPTLKENVRVGAGAKILGNVTVGKDSKVGANAVVVKDVPENCTVVGVPARIIKRDGLKTDEVL